MYMGEAIYWVKGSAHANTAGKMITFMYRGQKDQLGVLSSNSKPVSDIILVTVT